jgi:hypothetical protein
MFFVVEANILDNQTQYLSNNNQLEADLPNLRSC